MGNNYLIRCSLQEDIRRKKIREKFLNHISSNLLIKKHFTKTKEKSQFKKQNPNQNNLIIEIA